MDDNPKRPALTSRRAMVRYFLLAFIPSIALVGAITALIYHFEAKHERLLLRTNESHHVAMLSKTFADNFKYIVSDLMILAEHHDRLEQSLTGEESARENLARDFLSFCKHKGTYDQVRFLDETGMEVVRVNYNNGEPSVVSAEKLQLKGNRYYFKETFKLERGEVYLSPFDLNIENGAVERPLKPIIRFGAPFFDGHGKKRGIVILNFLGRNLLDNIERMPSPEPGRVMLLNRDGFWLKSPRPADEWGFMLEERRDRAFGNDFPDAWQAISGSESGQFLGANGLFTFETICPLLKTQGLETHSAGSSSTHGDNLNDEVSHWKLVHHVQPAFLGVRARRLLAKLLWANIAIGVLLVTASVLLARAFAVRKRTEDAQREIAQLNQLLLDTLPHPAMLIRKDRTIMAANRIARDAGAKIGSFCWMVFGHSLSTFLKKIKLTSPSTGKLQPAEASARFALPMKRW